MKKSISIAIKSNKKLAAFSYSIDEDLFGKISFKGICYILLDSLTPDSLDLAFNRGYMSINQTYEKNKRRLE